MSNAAWPASPDVQPSAPSPSKGRGCWFWGCLLSTLLLVLVGIGGYFVFTRIKAWAIDQAELYTELEQRELPQSNMSEAEVAVVQDQLESWMTAREQGESTEPLSLTGDQLNGLLRHDARFAGLRDMCYVHLDDDLLRAQVSLPLDAILDELPFTGLERLRGRFLNGDLALSLRLEHGIWHLHLVDLLVRGQALPPAVSSQLKAQNLLEDQHRNQELNKIAERFERIWIERGALHLQLR